MSLGVRGIEKGWVESPLARGLVWLVTATLRVFAELVYQVPHGMKRGLAQALGRLFFDLIQLRRHVVLHNLIRVFPREHQESMNAYRLRLEALGRSHWTHMICFLWELLERPAWTTARWRRRVRVHGFEHCQQLLDQGQGFFFLTAHLGNWELITKVGVGLGLPLAIITRYLRNLFVNEVWVQIRRSYGLELLEEFGSGLQVVRAIRRGRAVGFMMDQHTGHPHGILARFLGVECMCPKGLAVLATRLNAPIVPAYLLRRQDGTFDLYFERVMDFSGLQERLSRGELKNGSEELQRYHIEQCNERMEQWIRRDPEQYLWLHKRFKGVFLYEDPLPWAL
jgi:KDO2-lipid IV(A) lauroyltransferase